MFPLLSHKPEKLESSLHSFPASATFFSIIKSEILISRQEQQKRQVAAAAIEHITPLLGPQSIVGVGTGSTTNYFIDELAKVKHLYDATVSSSEASSARLREHGVTVIDLNAAPRLDVYVDGADEVNPNRQMIKGGGAALTREKIVASAADQFVCLVDESKVVDTLGAFPLPVEVIPMARSLVGRAIVQLGGQPAWREEVVTDNGNWIIDVHEFMINDPLSTEKALNDIPGVVCNGLFAINAAEVVLVASDNGVKQL